MDPEKLERIQLPVPSVAEKTIYNHLLAERLIRIMNNAAQPGTWGVSTVHKGGGVRGTRPPHQAPGALSSRPGPSAGPGRSQPFPLPHTHTPWATHALLSCCVIISGLLCFFSHCAVCARTCFLLSYPTLLLPVVPMSAALTLG